MNETKRYVMMRDVIEDDLKPRLTEDEMRRLSVFDMWDLVEAMYYYDDGAYHSRPNVDFDKVVRDQLDKDNAVWGD